MSTHSVMVRISEPTGLSPRQESGPIFHIPAGIDSSVRRCANPHIRAEAGRRYTRGDLRYLGHCHVMHLCFVTNASAFLPSISCITSFDVHHRPIYWIIYILQSQRHIYKEREKHSRKTLQALCETSDRSGQDILLGTLDTLDENDIVGRSSSNEYLHVSSRQK